MSSKEVDGATIESSNPVQVEPEVDPIPESITNTITGEDRLKTVKEQLVNSVAVSQENVSTILEWFGAERRGHRVVTKIRAALKANDLLTEPDFEAVPTNEAVSFKIASNRQEILAPKDPTYRISMLAASSNVPVYVAPNDSLEKVITLMMSNDFSQIPVMVGRTVKGIVTWRSIAEKMHLGGNFKEAQSLMEPGDAVIVERDATFFSVISILAEKNYALVRDKGAITGIITASDLSKQYHILAEPFLLVGEIEIGIRGLLERNLDLADLQEAKFNPSDDAIKSVDEMAFGQYCTLFEKSKTWNKLKLKIDQKIFTEMMHKVREIRNDVMHFDPDGLEDKDILHLKKVADFFKRLRDLEHFGK